MGALRPSYVTNGENARSINLQPEPTIFTGKERLSCIVKNKPIFIMQTAR